MPRPNTLYLILSFSANQGSAATPESVEFINYGFNAFTVEQSTSPILATQFKERDLGTVSSSYTFDFEDLKFRYHVGSFAAYSQQDAITINDEFVGLDDVSDAFGSLSENRQQTRTAVTEMQYHLFQVRLRIPMEQLAISYGYNEVQWTSAFINRLRILPQSYTAGDDLSDFQNFWNQFGTHVFSTIHLGGIIDGILVADRCSLKDNFGDEDKYLECLNADFRGHAITEDDECQDTEKSVEDRWIKVRGGEATELNEIITQFNLEDKVTVYNAWLDSLSVENYQVVGGQADGIWTAVQKAVLFGDHQLNNASSTPLSDDEWTNIADAMESAFTDYAQQLDAEENTVACAVAFSCHEGLFKEEDCQCTECSDVLSCCWDSPGTQTTMQPTMRQTVGPTNTEPSGIGKDSTSDSMMMSVSSIFLFVFVAFSFVLMA